MGIHTESYKTSFEKIFEAGIINYNEFILCLAIPGKVVSITGQLDETFRFAKVSFGGILKDVNLAMLPEAKIGDYVLVHVGVAISLVDEEEANKTFEYLKKIGELDEIREAQSPPVNLRPKTKSIRS